MKYTLSVDINLPLVRVIELFDDPVYYHEWQESLVSMERLEGEPGHAGTRTRLQHRIGHREITMIETINKYDLPHLLKATYESPGVWNQTHSRFTPLGSVRTRWTMDSEFRASGLVGMVTKFMPFMFKKQTRATMEAFRAFAEKKGD